MVAAKALGVGILVATLLANLSEGGEIISAGGGARAFLDQRAGEEAAVRPAFLGSMVLAGSGSVVPTTPQFATPQQTSVVPPAVARFVPAPPTAPTAAVTFAAPSALPAAPAITTPSYDAFVNFGTAAFAGQSSLTTGVALPWFASDSAIKAYGGVPNAQQVQDFGKTVIDRVASTFAQSGLAVSVTDDPSASSNHMLSVASGLSSSSSPGAIGVSTIGQDGFSFIDKLAYANSPDELMWAVAHNVAHELMHTFGGSHHSTVEGNNLDGAVADWSVLIDPNTKFSAESIAEITRNMGPDGVMSRSGSLAQFLDGDHQHEMLHAEGVPVPEPTTIALWTAMLGIGVIARRRSRASQTI